jgi:hypothetical protein
MVRNSEMEARAHTGCRATDDNDDDDNDDNNNNNGLYYIDILIYYKPLNMKFSLNPSSSSVHEISRRTITTSLLCIHFMFSVQGTDRKVDYNNPPDWV